MALKCYGRTDKELASLSGERIVNEDNRGSSTEEEDYKNKR